MDTRNNARGFRLAWRDIRLGVAALAAAFALSLSATDSLAQDATTTPPAAPAAVVTDPAATPLAAPAEAAPAEATVAAAAPAEEAAPEPTMDKGDTAWMLIATAIVLMMSIPGLALFYGGLVRAKNMLSVLMQVSTCAIIGLICWALWGYSLAFTDGLPGLAQFVGGPSKFLLAGVTKDSMAATFSAGVVIPELVFVAFQATFAAITAALVLGSVAERMKFSAVVVFSVLWPLLSYYPIAHMVWYFTDVSETTGFLFGLGALDFAGGTVVHINAGVAGLVGGILLGHRSGYKAEPWPPHSLTMTYIGAGLLWIGWFGFNAGSNLEANGGAGLAFINTMLATAAAGFSWILTEWVTKGKPSMLGLASGIVAGLVAITPACGTIGPMGAIILGLVVSPICVIFCSVIKSALNYDDTLDVFGIHGVGGIVGALATGILTAPLFGGTGAEDFSIAGQFTTQAIAVGVSFAWSAVASFIVFMLLKVVGLRASKEAEQEGLDIIEHGERAYHS
ncbi:MAG: ammonium transporter [Hyphomonadaceae bacterium]|nr:ammonium transporter [Hyphomonadaceae bacterium]